jgi:glycerol-3-phosphate acyltransferase PlsX
LTRSERTVARIAVDLLGGDGAPAVVVDGALHALHLDPTLRLLLVGPQRALDQVAGHHRVDRLETGANGGAIAGGAVRAAVRAVRDGLADAVVSAGPTASSVAAAVSGFGRLPGVSRPPLAALIPAAGGPVILLDVGACPDVDADDLVSHAALGARHAAAMLHPDRHPDGGGPPDGPRVGLLSIGTERGKGDRLRREAADLLAATALPAGARYVGTVEGHHVALGGRAEVVVTDGFTGNVLLKGLEGAAGLAGPARAAGPPDTAAPRAAVLLGVGGVFVVCHEAATATDLASGIVLAQHAFPPQQQPLTGADTPVRTPGGVRP